MAKEERSINAVQIKATPPRIKRWDDYARMLGMNRAEFARFAIDSLCDRLDAQAAAESRAEILKRHNLTP